MPWLGLARVRVKRCDDADACVLTWQASLCQPPPHHRIHHASAANHPQGVQEAPKTVRTPLFSFLNKLLVLFRIVPCSSSSCYLPFPYRANDRILIFQSPLASGRAFTLQFTKMTNAKWAQCMICCNLKSSCSEIWSHPSLRLWIQGCKDIRQSSI